MNRPNNYSNNMINNKKIDHIVRTNSSGMQKRYKINISVIDKILRSYLDQDKIAGFHIHWKNLKYYVQAFKHESSITENSPGTGSYERLEFLGDSVLHLILAEYLYNRYNTEDQGFLTRLRTKIENSESLVHIAKIVGLNRFIEMAHNVKINNHIIEDIVEAFIGAVYIDQNYTITSNIVINMIEAHKDLSNILYYDNNYKDILLRYYHQKAWGNPVYNDIIIDNKRKIFKVNVNDANGSSVGVGSANTKKQAEQFASKMALNKLGIMSGDMIDPEWYHKLKLEKKNNDKAFDEQLQAINDDPNAKKISRYNYKNILINKYRIAKIFAKYGVFIDPNIIKDIKLYYEAFTHRSYLKRPVNDLVKNDEYMKMLDDLERIRSVEFQDKSNERLIFLGNSVIHLIISQYLYELYPNKDEGFLTRLRIKLENRNKLSFLIRKSHLHRNILISSKIENDMNGRKNVNITSGCFEAFFGALYLDVGLKICKDFLLSIINKEINIEELANNETNYKDMLIIYFHKKKLSINPTYNLLGTEGPDHCKKFTMCMYDPFILTNYNKEVLISKATSNSKKNAEQLVAKDAFFYLIKKYGE
jgi:dsRNA-specific ribonuclease